MPRITPSTGASEAQQQTIQALEDDEPYKGVLRKPKDQQSWYSKGSAEFGGEDRLTIDWVLEDGDSIRDWISLRLGKQQNGTVSKLRMLLNALSDKPRETEIKWFDSDSMEWSYDGERAFNKLTEGSEVVFRGVHGVKQDGTAKFTIQKYGPAKPTKAKTTVEDSEPPF